MPSSARDGALPPWAHVSGPRRSHIERVARLLDTWAGSLNVSAAERGRWRRAAWLHDALKDAPARDLAALAGPEWREPKLRHGPAAARKAALEGETDGGVLDAVRYHSVGYAGWDRVGRALYLADYLEPGRPYLDAQHADWTRRVPGSLDDVLREVAAHRIEQLRAAGRTPLPETVAFWNALR